MDPVRRSPAKRLTRTLFAFAALFAVAIQALVVQTHIHAVAAPAHAAYEQAQHAGEPHDFASPLSAHAQTACVVCMTLATSGAATLADAGTIQGERSATFETATLSLPDAPRVLVHAWQSRAPPIAL